VTRIAGDPGSIFVTSTLRTSAPSKNESELITVWLTS
jgi:hypothetical protein